MKDKGRGQTVKTEKNEQMKERGDSEKVRMNKGCRGRGKTE